MFGSPEVRPKSSNGPGADKVHGAPQRHGETPMQRIQASALVAGLIALATVAAMPVHAQTVTTDCDEGVRVVEQTYTHAGVEYEQMPSHLEAGSELTVNFRLEGCGETQVSLVSYQAQGDFDLSQHDLFDVDTGVYAQGGHNLTVTVPECFFEIDFVLGAAIEHFAGPNGTYHGQDRIIAAVRGGVECGAPAAQVEVCPPTLSAKTRGDAAVELEWNSTTSAATHLVYRSEGSGTPSLLGEVSGEAGGMVDTTAKAGAAYTYELAVTTDGEKVSCATVQVGSMPSFPTAVGAVLAATLGVLGYAAMRRRR